MNLVADESIPQVRAAFADLGHVELIPGRKIQSHHLRDCQCLLVRTVTRVDKKLLDNTAVEFVGTATIGTDHVDQDYLKANNIGFSNAAGCNAEAASEYVISGLFALSESENFDPFKLKAGVIGYGNVGSRLVNKLQTLGIEVLINDPPLADSGNAEVAFVELDQIIEECDFISLHVPLTRDGDYPTYHLFDYYRLTRLTEKCLLVNCARGPVIDNHALSKLLNQREDLMVFLDTWENEPNIDRELLSRVNLATPHIAGYSVEGRLRGTQMILDATCKHFCRQSSWQMIDLLPDVIELPLGRSTDKLNFWQQLFEAHHAIWLDHLSLTRSTRQSDAEFARHFDSLRKVYEQRFEYTRYRISGITNKKAAAIAQQLLFRTA